MISVSLGAGVGSSTRTASGSHDLARDDAVRPVPRGGFDLDPMTLPHPTQASEVRVPMGRDDAVAGRAIDAGKGGPGHVTRPLLEGPCVAAFQNDVVDLRRGDSKPRQGTAGIPCLGRRTARGTPHDARVLAAAARSRGSGRGRHSLEFHAGRLLGENASGVVASRQPQKEDPGREQKPGDGASSGHCHFQNPRRGRINPGES